MESSQPTARLLASLSLPCSPLTPAATDRDHAINVIARQWGLSPGENQLLPLFSALQRL